jgi:hypothetical protein
MHLEADAPTPADRDIIYVSVVYVYGYEKMISLRSETR